MTINSYTYSRDELLGHNTSAAVSPQLLASLRTNEICSVPRTHRGVSAGKYKHRPITRAVSILPSVTRVQTNSAHQDNLIEAPRTKWDIPVILNTNTRSIINKIDELSILLRKQHVVIAGTTESWLKDCIPDAVISIDGYNVIRNNRKGRQGGGVMLYIQNELPFKRWEECESDNLESLWITIRPKNMPRSCSHLCIGLIYLPQGGVKETDIAMN